jgi:prevent-host-death family protein
MDSTVGIKPLEKNRPALNKPLRQTQQSRTHRSAPHGMERVDARILAQAARPLKGLYSVLCEPRRRKVRYSSQVKPISYLKANAAEVLTRLAEQREPLVITQNGEAKAVLQDVASFEETQETLALLKILALGNQAVAAGKVKPVADVVARLRSKQPKR